MNLRNEIKMFASQNKYEVDLKQINAKDVENTNSCNESGFDLNEAQEILNSGDLDAIIKYFDSNGYPYKSVENSITGKTVFTFEYKNHKYNYVFYSNVVDNESSQTENSGSEDVNSSTNNQDNQSFNVAKGIFAALSGKQKDKNFSKVYNGSIKLDYELLENRNETINSLYVDPLEAKAPHNGGDVDEGDDKAPGKLSTPLYRRGNVDDGGYDNIFEELSNIKPQLKEYIKMTLESKGLSYNDDVVEKYLNKWLTTAVRKDVPKFADNKLCNIITIEDAAAYVAYLVEQELNKDTPFASSIGQSLEMDLTLVSTADYFLTEEEKLLKNLMKKVANGEDSTSYIKDKNVLENYIDVYSSYVKQQLKSMYPTFSEQQINQIVEDAKNDTLNSLIVENDLYVIDDNLIKFLDACREKITEETTN